MAVSTYTELKASIANWLNRTDLTDEIADDFIKLTEADFNAKLRIRQMEQIDTVTIDEETETVPTGFISVRSFYLLLSSTKYPLEYITPQNLFEIRGGSRTGRPRSYTIEADNETTKHRLNIFASMFSPDNMEKKAREVERIKTEVEYLKGK
jgi:hypothetical protein